MSIKSIKFLIFSISNSFFLSFFHLAYAQGTLVPPASASIPNPLSVKDLSGFITLLLNTLFPIASLAAVFFLIYAGFMMVMAGGSEEKLSKAKTALVYTIIGIAILLGAKVLSAVICGTINQLGTTTLTCPTT